MKPGPAKGKPEWECVRCGRCCLEYGCMIAATDEDLSRWKREGRQDILDKVKVIADPKTGRVIAADLWFNPATGKEYVYCPWLRRNRDGKAACLIHGTKPQYCRDYVCRRHVKA